MKTASALAFSPAVRKAARPREQEVLRMAASLNYGGHEHVLHRVRGEILRWVQGRAATRLPADAWEGRSFDCLSGGRNSSASRLIDGDADIWAVRAEDPDRTVPGRIWTTEVALGHSGDGHARLGVRLYASTAEDRMVVAPHAPGFVHRIAEACDLYSGPVLLRPEPIAIADDAAADSLVDLILDPRRTLPLFVLSIADGAHQPLLDGEALGRATLGLARVVVVPARFTWRLTRRFGQLRSVFAGAVRAYLPGFTVDADPHAHRLELAERLADEESASRCTRWMRCVAAEYSLRHIGLDREIVPFAAVRRAALSAEQSRLVQLGASDADQLDAARRTIGAFEKQVADLNEQLRYFDAEEKAAQVRAETAEQQLHVAHARIQQLFDAPRAENAAPAPRAENEAPALRAQPRENTIPDVPQDLQALAGWCDQSLTGRLVLTQSARRGLRSARFGDPALVARCLNWLAHDYRDRRRAGGEGSLRDIVVESGIRNAPCGSDAHEVDWEGRTHSVLWHIKNGGNTRDPARCLRIYYFWNEAAQQVVVTDLPEHRVTACS